MTHLVLYLSSLGFDLPLLIIRHRISELSFLQISFATQWLDVFQIVLCDTNSSIQYVEIISALEFVQVITCRLLIWITKTGLNFLRLGVNFTTLSICRFFQIIILYLHFTYTLRARQKTSRGRWKVREGEGVIEWEDVGWAPIQLKSKERHSLISKAIGSDPLSAAAAFIFSKWKLQPNFQIAKFDTKNFSFIFSEIHVFCPRE